MTARHWIAIAVGLILGGLSLVLLVQTTLHEAIKCPPGVVCIGAPLPAGKESRTRDPWGPLCRPADMHCRPREG